MNKIPYLKIRILVKYLTINLDLLFRAPCIHLKRNSCALSKAADK